jgi:DnaK suppressor protein
MPVSGSHRHYFTIEQREALQRQLEDALARLHEPDFGLCVDCGADIPYARLSATPTATRCVACQTRHEQAAGGAPRA